MCLSDSDTVYIIEKSFMIFVLKCVHSSGRYISIFMLLLLFLLLIIIFSMMFCNGNG